MWNRRCSVESISDGAGKHFYSCDFDTTKQTCNERVYIN